MLLTAHVVFEVLFGADGLRENAGVERFVTELLRRDALQERNRVVVDFGPQLAIDSAKDSVEVLVPTPPEVL